MNHSTLTNGFAKKHITHVKVNTTAPEFYVSKGLQVYILSECDDTVSLLLMHLSHLKTVHTCKVYNDVESMFYGATNGKAILFADATLLSKEITDRVKNMLPEMLVIAVKNFKEVSTTDFHENLFNYISSPVVFGDVFAIINQAILYYKSQEKSTQQKRSFVLIKSEYRLIKINLADILFVEGMKDYVKIWLKDKAAPLTTLQNLKEFESRLPHTDFIRVHKSYIVALQHIDCIARNEIMMGTFSIPVGDAFRNGLNGFISKHS